MSLPPARQLSWREPSRRKLLLASALAAVLTLLAVAGSSSAVAQSLSLPQVSPGQHEDDDDGDAPRPGARPSAAAAAAMPAPPSYAEALQAWRSLADVNSWIGLNFAYDRSRALQLSESQRGRGPAPAIHESAAFFRDPSGICVDLARFGVETLRSIAAWHKPRYLMIEFDPVQIQGQTLRRHWLAVAEDEQGRLLMFADSRYPGQVHGPYARLDDFIADYAQLRQRRIVAHRELADFRRQMRTPQARREASPAVRNADAAVPAPPPP